MAPANPLTTLNLTRTHPLPSENSCKRSDWRVQTINSWPAHWLRAKPWELSWVATINSFLWRKLNLNLHDIHWFSQCSSLSSEKQRKPQVKTQAAPLLSQIQEALQDILRFVEKSWVEVEKNMLVIYGCFLKRWVFLQIIHCNRVSIINLPFWGTPIFGNTHIIDFCKSLVVFFFLEMF